jgi:hypothetical protein
VRLGDARGWLLLILEIVWLAALAASLALLPTDLWLVCYALLAGFILAWVGQAIAAYRRARAVTGRSTGAGWLLAVAPVVIVLLTGFWLVAGATSSPSATFQRYVEAWQSGDAAAAASLFVEPEDAARLAEDWEAEGLGMAERIRALADADPDWELDREHPERNLRFDYQPGSPLAGTDRVTFDVQVVRRVTVPTTFLGLVPASRSETMVVDTIGHADLVRRPLTGPLAFTGASLWLIDGVTLDAGPR